jgi:hypothetical protein
VEFKPVAELRSGAVLFTCVEPRKRATEETLQEMPDAALALLSAWCFVSKTMARHSLSLACFNQHAVFFAPGSKKVVILPCGPLVVLDKPYSNSSAELSAVGEYRLQRLLVTSCNHHNHALCASQFLRCPWC